MIWQHRSSTSRCAEEGNWFLRFSTSPGAGLRPLIQETRTCRAVCMSSFEVIGLQYILGWNVPICTVPGLPVRAARTVRAKRRNVSDQDLSSENGNCSEDPNLSVFGEIMKTVVAELKNPGG